MATPHIEAQEHEIADSVLLPGDPLRAKYIAEKYLEGPVKFNSVRNMLGYTGTWKGTKVSVMGTGMGIPSHAIYVEELCRFYRVKKLIRLGSCGAIQKFIHLRDIILAMSACTDSSLNTVRFKGADYAPTASFSLLYKAYETAGRMQLKPHVGSVLSTDLFYSDDESLPWQKWAEYAVLGLEMEAAALYTIAAKYGAEALAVLTVSDSIPAGETTSSEEREKTFTDMMELALETLIF